MHRVSSCTMVHVQINTHMQASNKWDECTYKTRIGTPSPTVYAHDEHIISMHKPDSVLLLQALNLQCESIISLLRFYSSGEMSHHLGTKFYYSNLGGRHRRGTH